MMMTGLMMITMAAPMMFGMALVGIGESTSIMKTTGTTTTGITVITMEATIKDQKVAGVEVKNRTVAAGKRAAAAVAVKAVAVGCVIAAEAAAKVAAGVAAIAVVAAAVGNLAAAVEKGTNLSA